LSAGTSLRIDVLGDEGSLLMLFYANGAGPAQSQIVQVGEHGGSRGALARRMSLREAKFQRELGNGGTSQRQPLKLNRR
jgi:hypothetical protein